MERRCSARGLDIDDREAAGITRQGRSLASKQVGEIAVQVEPCALKELRWPTGLQIDLSGIRLLALAAKECPSEPLA